MPTTNEPQIPSPVTAGPNTPRQSSVDKEWAESASIYMTPLLTNSSSTSSGFTQYEYNPTPSPGSDGVSEESVHAEALMELQKLTPVDYMVDSVGNSDGANSFWVDESQGKLSQEVVEAIFQRALCLMIVREDSEMGLSTSEANGFCSTGIVLCRDKQKRFFTAMHSLQEKQITKKTRNGNDVLDMKIEKISFYTPTHPGWNAKIRFLPDHENNLVDEANKVTLRGNETWTHGIDIAWGDPLLGQSNFDAFETKYGSVGHFETVRDTFELQAGQKVGIVAYNRYGISMEHVAVKKSTDSDDPEINEKTVEDAFGPANSIVIYCGKISFVGETHIEYGLNSFKGCSGAIVFLLDVVEQHFSVGEEDKGKAIAVHAGYHPSLGTNIGFKFHPKFLAEP